MRARARRAYCKKCRANLGSKSSGWSNIPDFKISLIYPHTILFIVLLGLSLFYWWDRLRPRCLIWGRGRGGRRAVFMVDHDSRKRVAKKFRHFFFQNIIFLFFPRAALARAKIFFQNFSQKFFKDSTRLRSCSSSQQQQPAATRNNQGIYTYTNVLQDTLPDPLAQLVRAWA